MSEKKKNKKEFWLSRIKDQEANGLNKIAYCRLHNISLSTFYYWQDILKKKSFSPSLFSTFDAQMSTQNSYFHFSWKAKKKIFLLSTQEYCRN